MTALPAAPPPPPPPPPPPSAPSPSPPASVVTCPACRAQAPAGTRFCPNCGTSLTQPVGTAPLAAAGQPPVDIRQKVDADRGILKRLQLLLPGFRGYRQGEDLREADSLLRLQVADKVHLSVKTIQDCRTTLTNAGQFQALTSLADALADLQKLEGEIRHAAQGYSGISPATRIRPEQLDQLYQYDYGFAEAADQLNQTLEPLRAAGGNPSMPGAMDAVNQVRGQVSQLDTAFRARMNAIQGIMVQ
ncbi:MAG TPA: zinc ribbon domain-containing protein [Thermoplasmata archaeon]|nr:zinc ribbon domain-containing protein [Thermoplasmata archaeon]